MPSTSDELPPTLGAVPKPGRRWYRLLLVLPFLWCIAAVPWAGHVPYAFGHVPFLLVWMVAGVLIGSAAIGVVYLLDARHGHLEEA
ncbi:hypothetical protein GCM10010464_69640 [Pseudonocardia yunnanensis]|uniref:DUF3311 domain-containing protein n=1 Tax=Pseudonocardia yunnanensis TaxID=58107 RepID=A0ABW4EZM7_9PSEU